jgi:RNA polymerase sigma-B factor
MFEQYQPLARSLAWRYRRSSEPMDDLLQVASIGLLNAIDRFDPDRGLAFSTFAVPTILGELRRHFRDRTWAIRVPRTLQERSMGLERSREELATRLGRTPTADELAEEMGLTVEEVVEAIEAAGAYRPDSLDRPLDPAQDADDFLAVLGSEDPAYDRAEARATVDRLSRVLTPREREVLRLRFEEDLTQADIGARVGISQMHVSRLIRQAIERLREAA